ncbi:predicted protein [Naegleria gruberi]|uniref:Predicted protein n=1 Tax=Naegleria gruberi TaxID=5762 RepID=D2UZ16_NAEGR|nr:uncharacterized protein NAEGRDRAFT_61778 [Naegleria gruberi]EFC49867.1 predicted protein [Naegleria gruberi]|eukprot:XP_002682611.1 predicted protein [Naegleria gruberi strain NEG-M]
MSTDINLHSFNKVFPNGRIFLCTMVNGFFTFAIAIAALCYYYLYSGGTTKVEIVRPVLDRISMLNSSFYTGKIQNEDFVIKNEFYDIFTNTLIQMKNCQLRMRGFYGESGIGKTTMLKESLKTLKPYPYFLISLTKTTTIQELAERMNIFVKGIARWSDIQITMNQYTGLLKQTEQICPIIVIDNANRNTEITENFVNMIREYTSREVGLLIVASDGYFDGLDTAGGRLWTSEFSEPSNDFGVKYLNKLNNITDEQIISRVLDITGTKPVYLEYVRHCINTGSDVNYRCLQKIIDGLVLHEIELLPVEIQIEIRKLAFQLLRKPISTNISLPYSMPEETQKKIYRSNILRKGRGNDDLPIVIFQNRIVKRYFENLVAKLNKE